MQGMIERLGVVIVLLMSSLNVYAADLFFIDNKTSCEVTVGVGNFIPTSYIIRPFQSAKVIVTTNNQNIQINEVQCPRAMNNSANVNSQYGLQWLYPLTLVQSGVEKTKPILKKAM